MKSTHLIGFCRLFGKALGHMLLGAAAALVLLPASIVRADQVDVAAKAYDQGNYDQAIKILTPLIDAGSLWELSMLRALEIRSGSYGMLNCPDDLLADCNRGLEIDSGYGPLLINRAIYYIDIGKYRPAQADLRKALEDRRLNEYGKALAYFHRGRTWHLQSNLPRALEDLDVALKWQPNLLALRLERGTILVEQGKFEPALADFERIVTEHSEYPGAYLGRARALIGLNEFERALADLDAAEKTDDGQFRIAYHRGRAYLFLQENDDAIAAFTQALALEPDDRETHDLRGIAAFNLGDFKKAAADFSYKWNQEGGAYQTLWLHIARSRLSPPIASDREIARAAWSSGPPGTGTWPEPVLRVVTNEVSEDQAFATAARDPKSSAQFQCEANLFLGEFALIANRKAHSRDLLKKAASLCLTASPERAAALAELDRLGG